LTCYVEVRPSARSRDPRAAQLRARCSELGLAPERVDTARLYRLDGVYRPKDAAKVAARLLADPVTETFRIRAGSPPPAQAPLIAIDVWYRPEVADPAAESVEKAIQELGLRAPERVRCGQRCAIAGSRIGRREAELLAEKVLANEVVHQWQIS
jgi:phosphoribosylformylglycinamidine (FGAM) synthase PurS component